MIIEYKFYIGEKKKTRRFAFNKPKKGVLKSLHTLKLTNSISFKINFDKKNLSTSLCFLPFLWWRGVIFLMFFSFYELGQFCFIPIWQNDITAFTKVEEPSETQLGSKDTRGLSYLLTSVLCGTSMQKK